MSDSVAPGSNPPIVGIDFGTSNTAAVLGLPDGRVRTLLFDGVPQLPSAVFLEESGELLVGRDARYAARSRPERLEPHPKQHVDERTVLLGDAELPVTDLIAAVLRRVADEASRVAGAPVDTAVLTCPVAWGTGRRATLSAAAGQVFARHELVDEPVAAASRFAALAGGQLAPGGLVAVYDLGAGTFDAAVLRRGADGFEVLASAGLTDAGGLDIDAAIVTHLEQTYRDRDPDRWQRLTQPVTPADRTAAQRLWDDVREAKELLSRATSARIPIPLFDDEAPLGREQLELLAQPVLDRTVTVLRQVLADAGAEPGQLAGLYLVGGASRLPLAATLLHRALGVGPATLEQPELVVAEGSLTIRTGPAGAGVPDSGSDLTRTDPDAGGRAPLPGPTPAAPAAEDPWPTGDAPGTAAGGSATPSWRRPAVATAAVLGVVAVVAGVALWLPDGSDADTDEGRRTVSQSSSAPATPTETPTPTPTPPPAGGDACLVGTWTQTSLVYHDVNMWGRSVVLSGKGMRYTWRADGTGETRIDQVRLTGKSGGNRYEAIHNGRMTWRYRAGNGQIIYSGASSKGTTIYKVNGSIRESKAMGKPSTAPVSYVCVGDGLSITHSDYTVEARRNPAGG
ncbi:Hsp70 family protein [Solwaraspora sp. WMMD1047]|uniref:Hsp70 family protein n=1 Tax=Solwaraspora sp. WMMD1047 TaxID=3016102 RepID=UPI0024179731|nr:Hsp70 family protein [Solwaraspora sp. WMMD1047]MDG4832353.1 Hsp70 family protein [Solwaraspora sp. WMMD1047]